MRLSVSIGVRQHAHGYVENGVQPSGLYEGPGADGITNLRAVVPDLRELAADIEPRRRLRFASPRDGEARRTVQRPLIEELGEIGARPFVQVGEDPRAQLLRCADPKRIQLVDERRDLPLVRERTLGSAQRFAVTIG